MNNVNATSDKDDEFAQLKKEVQKMRIRESAKEIRHEQCQICGGYGHMALSCNA